MESVDVGRYGVNGLGVKLSLGGELGPGVDDFSYLANDPLEARHLLAITDCVEVVESDVLGLAVHPKVVLARPLAAGPVCVDDVKCRCQRPPALARAEEREVLGVIVAVDRRDVEDHAPVGLLQARVVESQLLDRRRLGRIGGS